VGIRRSPPRLGGRLPGDRRRSGFSYREQQPLLEVRPGRIIRLGHAELLDRLSGMCAGLPASQREGCRRRPDDAVLARQQASRMQVEQAGQQLAPGQVARGTEQHDNVVFGSPGRVIPGHVKILRLSGAAVAATGSHAAVAGFW
jgi:hypothetical protein